MWFRQGISGSSFQVNFQTKSPISQGITDVNPFWEFIHCLHTQGNDWSLWAPEAPLNLTRSWVPFLKTTMLTKHRSDLSSKLKDNQPNHNLPHMPRSQSSVLSALKWGCLGECRSSKWPGISNLREGEVQMVWEVRSETQPGTWAHRPQVRLVGGIYCRCRRNPPQLPNSFIIWCGHEKDSVQPLCRKYRVGAESRGRGS